MIQGAQRAVEGDEFNKSEITNIIYDNSKTDAVKIAMMQGMFSKVNDLHMAKGILNNTTISLDQKVHILNALYQLAKNENDEVQQEINNVFAKRNELKSTIAVLEKDKPEFKLFIQKEIIDIVQHKLSEVKECIAAAEQHLSELIQHQQHPEISKPKNDPKSESIAKPISVEPSPVSESVLNAQIKHYLAANYSSKSVTSQRIFGTDLNNKYTQVNLDDGEFYITFDSSGNHMWTDGPFEKPIPKIKKKIDDRINGSSRRIIQTSIIAPVEEPQPDSDTPDNEPEVIDVIVTPAQDSDESEAPEPIPQEPIASILPNSSPVVPVVVPVPSTNGLIFNPIDESIYKPSDVISNIFSQIKREVSGDIRSRSRTNEKYYLGYTANEIRENIIAKSEADFTTGYQDDISAYDKVLLYCFFNMKKHVCTAHKFFDSIENLEQYFKEENKQPMLIDLNCGPVTSLLAMADMINNKTGRRVKINYVGIDNSIEMMQRGDEIIRNSFLLSDEAEVQFYQHWNDSTTYIKSKLSETNLLLINASYLFDNNTLNENELARFVVGLSKEGIDTIFLNQNSPVPVLNQKFENFKQIVSSFNLMMEEELTVNCMYSQNDKNEPKEEKVRYSILKRIG